MKGTEEGMYTYHQVTTPENRTGKTIGQGRAGQGRRAGQGGRAGQEIKAPGHK